MENKIISTAQIASLLSSKLSNVFSSTPTTETTTPTNTQGVTSAELSSLIKSLELPADLRLLIAQKIGDIATFITKESALPLDAKLAALLPPQLQQQAQQLTQQLAQSVESGEIVDIENPLLALKLTQNPTQLATQPTTQNIRQTPASASKQQLTQTLIQTPSQILTETATKTPSKPAIYLTNVMWLETNKTLPLLTLKPFLQNTFIKTQINDKQQFSIIETFNKEEGKSHFSSQASSQLIKQNIISNLNQQKDLPTLLLELAHFTKKITGENDINSREILKKISLLFLKIPQEKDLKKDTKTAVEIIETLINPNKKIEKKESNTFDLSTLLKEIKKIIDSEIKNKPLNIKENSLPDNKLPLAQKLLLPPIFGLDFIQPQKRAAYAAIENMTLEEAQHYLSEQIKGVLSRNTLHDLASLTSQKSEQAPHCLFFEFPMIGLDGKPDIFHAKIEWEESYSENKGKQEKSTCWKALLAFDLHQLGAMHVEFSLFKNKIASKIWAEKKSTLDIAKKNLPFLEKSFLSVGFQVGEVSCEQGAPLQKKHLNHYSILDIHA